MQVSAGKLECLCKRTPQSNTHTHTHTHTHTRLQNLNRLCARNARACAALGGRAAHASPAQR
eukprot:3237844-Rhodomonas_salina.1